DDPKKDGKPKDPDPLKVPIIPDGDWKEHKDTEAGFAVLLPGTPKAAKWSIPGLDELLKGQEFTLVRPAEEVSFVAGDLREDKTRPDEFLDDFTLLETNRLEFTFKGKLVRKADVNLDKHSGKELHLEVPGKGMVVERLYLVKDGADARLHTLSVAGPQVKPGQP